MCGQTKARYVSRRMKYNKMYFQIRQCFSCLFDEGFPEICKKFNSNNGFFKADQHKANIGFAILQVLSLKSHHVFNFMQLFAMSHQADMKTLKDILFMVFQVSTL